MTFQLLLAALSLSALALQTSDRERLRALAPLFGLASQPFWFLQAHAAHAWGMEVVVAAYAALWVVRLIKNVNRRRIKA